MVFFLNSIRSPFTDGALQSIPSHHKRREKKRRRRKTTFPGWKDLRLTPENQVGSSASLERENVSVSKQLLPLHRLRHTHPPCHLLTSPSSSDLPLQGKPIHINHTAGQIEHAQLKILIPLNIQHNTVSPSHTPMASQQQS